MDVIALGNIVADFVAAPVKRIPNWGELYNVEHPITLNIGGNAAIFSACSSRLGLNTGLMGRVGDDKIGELLLDKLNGFDVNVSQVKTSKTCTTSATLVIANASGERSFFHHLGANREVNLEDIDFKYLSSAKALLLCSYFIMPGLEGNAAREILIRAKESGLTTFFDVAWDPFDKWELGDFLEYIDVFIPNEDEIGKLTKINDVEKAAQVFLDKGVGTIAVKMGEKGCLVMDTKGEKIRLDAHNVQAVDTTGAGDTFNTGFVYGTLKGWSLEKKTKFANAAAALSVTKLGGTTAAPTVDEVENFLKSQS